MNSPFHDQAVRDVAEALGRDNSVFHFAMTVNDGEVAEKYKTERYAVSQRERVLELAQGIVEEYSPCEISDAYPRLDWCYTHNTKRCGQKALYEKATAVLAASAPEKAPL